MRTITDHKLNGLNDSLDITADDPSNGGASHNYTIRLGNISRDCAHSAYRIKFQEGAIAEAGGVNGISNEALVAIIIDRLRGFQSGQFANRDNAISITHLEDALMRMQKRTRDRMARGVEGTHQV